MDFLKFEDLSFSSAFSEPQEDIHLEYKTATWKLPKNLVKSKMLV